MLVTLKPQKTSTFPWLKTKTQGGARVDPPHTKKGKNEVMNFDQVE